MTTEALKSCTLKKLAEMAKKRGVSGWHDMRKDQLVRALARLQAKPAVNGKALHRRQVVALKVGAKTVKKVVPPTRRSSLSRPTPALKRLPTLTPSPVAKSTSNSKPATNSKPLVSKPAAAAKQAAPAPLSVSARSALASKENLSIKASKIHQRLAHARAKQERLKNLASCNPPGLPQGYSKDRLIAMVRGPYWLHAYWELTRQGVRRAEAAMGQDWHAAKPVLRLLEVSGGGTTSSSERVVRDIEIHGDVNNWYVSVQDPPKSYRLEIGYVSAGGKFFVLARSNVVHTPRSGASDAIDENWTEVVEDFDKIFAMSGGYSMTGVPSELQEVFEERLRRPMGSPMMTKFGSGANGIVPRRRGFSFEMDAELIVFGTTEPDAHVTLQGEPVKIRPDGTFTVRYSMPNCRQVIPAVACSADGVEQRTVILAVERNTKSMEPLVRDNNE